MCTSPNLPGIAWASSSDASRDFPGVIRCVKVETPLPFSGGDKSWLSFWRITRLIEGLPW